MELTRKIANLEAVIRQEMTRIAGAFHDSYEKFIPCLKATRLDRADSLQKLIEEISQKLNDIDGTLNGLDVSSAKEELSELQQQLESIREARGFVESIEEVERHLVKAYVVEEGILTRARTVHDAVEALQSAEKSAEIYGVEHKICGSLAAEVRSQREYLCFLLSEYYRNAVEFSGESSKHVVSIGFKLGPFVDASEHFAAMAEVKQLEPRLHKLAEFITEKMCTAIIYGGGGNNVVKVNLDDILEQKQIKVRLPTKQEKHDPLNAIEVFGALDKLFQAISSILAPIVVHQQSLPIFLGKHIEKPLMSLILKEVISVCIPALSRPEDPIVAEVMAAAEAFRGKLIEYTFFNDASPTFTNFAQFNDRVFIDRRCMQVLTKARELILKPYVKLVPVGYGKELLEETVEDFKNLGWDPKFSIESGDESMPCLLGLNLCQVSESVVELMKIVEDTLKQAALSDNEMAFNRLALTARNIVQLFTLIAYRQHRDAISSIPQQAAVFFNNCYFIAHRVIMLPFAVFRDFDQNKFEIYRPMFAENIPQLRELAAKALEDLLAQCRRNLSGEFVDRTLFASSNPRGDKLRDRRVAKTLHRCVEQISTVAASFREVMVATIYTRSIANLVTFMLCEIGETILSMEDICQYDANQMAIEIQRVIDELMPLFQIEDYNAMHKMCSQALFRIKEVAFCLQGSLQGIDDRWCDGKGPLADLLNASEVRHLVKALFSNTDQRKQLLVKIS
ncbi:unnamed protein product, partial [Mesorhabditis belari]|uniref:Centromere/kinetochore protein zw10 n=1 Tax=Mesorhabditis belari TaxID=2138241 RepID=A0AAF3ED10_9BILA